jgi:hypothetical protein
MPAFLFDKSPARISFIFAFQRNTFRSKSTELLFLLVKCAGRELSSDGTLDSLCCKAFHKKFQNYFLNANSAKCKTQAQLSFRAESNGVKSVPPAIAGGFSLSCDL